MEIHWHAHGEHEIPDRPGRDGSPRGTDGARDSHEWLTPREVERAAGMRFAKRRNDYLLGRFTAKRAAAVYIGLPDLLRASLARLEVVNAAEPKGPSAFQSTFGSVWH